ncbi:MAG: TetR/AcrR family transcriptional regulator [Myxococcales bacterium]|nr:TetR/AcrR family transcriptional regulator [Myxococcales bacterium]
MVSSSAPAFDALGQRDKKRARTRIAILDALIERLDARSMEEVAISELALAAGVSQATVFNHFGGKADIVTYFIALWGIEVGLVARRAMADCETTKHAIEAVFVATAETTARHPGVMLEIIAHQATLRQKPELPAISPAERLLRFGDDPDALEQPAGGLETVLPALISRAVSQGELPPDTDLQAVLLGLASIFFGVPLILARHQPDQLVNCYRQQLALFWRGIS